MSSESESSVYELPAQPARGVWRRRLLGLAFLYISLMGWGRVQQALQDWDLLVKIGIQPGPLYLVISGALWGILGLGAVVLLYVKRTGAGRAVFGLSCVIAATYWFDYYALGRNRMDTINWPFGWVVTLVGLLFCAWVTRVLPPFRAPWIRRS